MATALVNLLAVLFPLLACLWSLLPGRKEWDPRGKHCYVTGGSSGLGLSLAILLAKKGADVSIVARNQERLKIALQELEKVRQTTDQILQAYSFSLNDEMAAEAALEAASKPHGGRSPDAFFLCAGSSTPRFFVDEDEATLRRGMENAFWVQSLTALAAAKRMCSTNSHGKIVFISSVLGLMGTIGYSSYAPGKHALRGLAETLRQELLLYSISVHIFFPATILSPGLETENITKPKITLKLEEDDSGQTPEECADALLAGVQRGEFHISIAFLSNIFRASARGASPHNNVLLDLVYSLIGRIGLTVWRRGVDATVVEHRPEHEEYLREKGLVR